MRGLTASDLLRVWEEDGSEALPRRALRLVALGCPELDAEALAGLTVGQRDARLLVLRALTFGPRLDGFVRCPVCQEALEPVGGLVAGGSLDAVIGAGDAIVRSTLDGRITAARARDVLTRVIVAVVAPEPAA